MTPTETAVFPLIEGVTESVSDNEYYVNFAKKSSVKPLVAGVDSLITGRFDVSELPESGEKRRTIQNSWHDLCIVRNMNA